MFIEQYAEYAPNQFDVKVRASSSDLIKCDDNDNYLIRLQNDNESDDKKKARVTKLAQTISLIQRDEKRGTYVNKGLQEKFLAYQAFLDDSVAKMEEAQADLPKKDRFTPEEREFALKEIEKESQAYLPENSIALATEPGKSLEESRYLLIVDGKQRLTALVRAAKKLGREIAVEFRAVIYSKLQVNEIAKKFVELNSCNAMGASDFVNAQYYAGELTELFGKIGRADELGHIYGYKVVPRKSKGGIENEFSVHTILGMLGYGLRGETNKFKIVKLSKEYSQVAVNSILLSLSILIEEIGFKEFRRGKHVNDVFSSVGFLNTMARVVMNEPITDGVDSRLSEDDFRAWLRIISTSKNGKGHIFYKFCEDNNGGSLKCTRIMYTSLTSEPCEGSKSFGVLLPSSKNKSGIKKITMKSGGAIENRPVIVLHEDSSLRKQVEGGDESGEDSELD